MQLEFEPETLIDEVRKRPGIWDNHSMDYRCKQYKQRAWDEIVHAVSGPIANSLNKTELRELELELQKKWKSYRDCHNKTLKNKRLTKRPYIYARQLSFLDSLLLGKCRGKKPDDDGSDSNGGGDNGSNSGEDRRKGKKRKKWIKRTIKLNKPDTDEEEVTEVQRVSDSDDEAIHHINLENKMPEQFDFANTHNMDDHTDCDRMFLLSLMPYLKSIPSHQRLNVKMELMQVLQNAASTSHEII